MSKMTMATTTIPSSTTSTPPTTIFTPPPACSGLYLSAVFGSSLWHADAWPDTVCDTSQSPQASLSCLPEGKDTRYPGRIYSSGHHCPFGMTTVTSTLASDGVWCCPSHLTMNAVALICEQLLTEGNITVGGTNCDATPTTYAFGHNQAGLATIGNDADAIPLGNVQVSATAEALFLLQQTSATESSVTSSLAPEQTNEGDIPAHTNGTLRETPDALNTAQIGGAIGGAMGAALLLCLSFFLIRQHRNKQRDKLGKDHPDESYNKPELESGGGNRAELDALATRSELEGTLVENRGAGIHVQKSELEGTGGVTGLTGVYVKRKPELDASTSPPEPTHQRWLEMPELEAAPISPRDITSLDKGSTNGSRGLITRG
ncbi:hypothetical protein F5B20DRAFT_280459 [Whalleya microplaca]|nr:hypothetical protein F5B20DRAFT_280459 [Whalleya microplaca]